MASKIFTSDLKVGMFVADLDRPWVDTPFLLQGFLIENEEQVLALKTHCNYVMVDRARSIGAEFESVSGISAATNTMPPLGRTMARPASASQGIDPDTATPLSTPEDRAPRVPRAKRAAAPNERAAPAAPRQRAASDEATPLSGYGEAESPGFFARMVAGWK